MPSTLTGDEIPAEIMYYPYPDTFEKQVMNDLAENDSISKKKFQGQEVEAAVEIVLDVFEANGYVTSANVVDPSDGITYKKWSVTPFFRSRIQAQKDYTAEQDVIKLALWNQKNQLMAAATNHLSSMSRAAVNAPMDVNVGESESEMHDRIKPELDALKKRMQSELDEKMRLKRVKEEETENAV